MAYPVQHGSEGHCTVSHSWLLNENETIIDINKFRCFLTGMGVLTSVHDSILAEIKAPMVVPKVENA